ncbi:CrcB family protein [Lacisediminihabitans sp. FW035]
MHLRIRYLAVVALGGMVGTALREALSIIVPSAWGIPVIILVINVVGAFALGALLEALARTGADEGRRRSLRLLLGTGVLGGFTTYSALATDTSQLLADGRAAAAIGYAVATLVVGAATTFAGIAIASAVHQRRQITADPGAAS